MRKGMKKIVAILLAVALMITVVPANQIMVNAATSAQGSTSEIDDAVEETVNAEVYLVHYATNKIITMDGTNDNPIDCTVNYNKDSVPDNAKMTIYYGIGNWGDSDGKEVVNFVNKVNKKSWKADGEKVWQINTHSKPSGWESVMMEPQGDGTVAFRSCNSGDYITVEDEKLGLVEIKTDEGELVSNNEKFVMYTTTTPKTAKNVTLSNISGGEMTVTWDSVTETAYSGYEVLYATSEDGEYKSAGYTAGNTLNITNLSLSTTYYVKVRTIVNKIDGIYADSKIAYATTLSDYKPTKPANVEVVQKDGKMVLTWDKANGAKKYTIYRAVSRYATYEELATVTDTTYTDTNPNASKYKNYYMIQSSNDADKSEFSDPASLETTMFGPNAYVFADTDDQSQIDALTAEIFEKQHYSQFGSNRYALMYKPGDYTSTETAVETGYYTQTLGLGKVPTEVSLYNVKTPAALSGNNVTCNFWQGIENVTIKDFENNTDNAYFMFQWAVSQAAPARRLNVERKAAFDWWYGWASGGYFADTRFQKAAGSYSQQQYYYRNCQMDEGIYGVNWNVVAQGCAGINSGNSSDNSGKPYTAMVDLLSGEGITNWDARGCSTLITETEEIREKPFLYFDTDKDEYRVFIPAMRKNSQGISWSETDMGEGTSLSLDKYFYVARADKDNAQTLNAALKAGKNILLTPGIYRVDEPLVIDKANTVVLGIGMATIIPDNKEAAIKIADVGGVSVAGIILDAGNYSKALLVAGEEGCNKDHSENPTVLQDVIYRVGGTGELGRADQCQVLHSNDVILDHTWIWRADHGDYVGWDQNTSKNGLVVNGDNVTAYGLFCEHFQEYDIIWRGENGKTYFLQNEKCYDPQNQAEWMSHDGTKNGYAAYKVTENVKNHYAVGLGVYDVFINTNGASIYVDNAIEVPNTPGVMIENACIVEIANASGPQVGINHIVNNTTVGIRNGAGNNGGYAIQRLLSYCNTDSKSLPDYYTAEADVTVQEEVGETPTRDEYAEKDITKEPASKDNEKPLWEMTEADFDKKMEDSEKPSVDPKPPVTPDDPKVEDKVVKLKKGQKFSVGRYTYKITKVSGKKGNVSLVSVKTKYRKKLKKAVVRASVKYKGYTFKVTAVGKKAFKNCKKLTKVTIGKNVKTIYAKAFYNCSKLKTLVVKGKALKKISKTAFAKKTRKKLKIKAKKVVKKRVLKSLKRKK